MSQFPGFALPGLYIQPGVTLSGCPATPGCPIRRSPDQSLFGGSPELIAAYNVLHRLCTPRHPPCTLSSLTAFMMRCIGTAARRRVTTRQPPSLLQARPKVLTRELTAFDRRRDTSGFPPMTRPAPDQSRIPPCATKPKPVSSCITVLIPTIPRCTCQRPAKPARAFRLEPLTRLTGEPCNLSEPYPSVKSTRQVSSPIFSTSFDAPPPGPPPAQNRRPHTASARPPRGHDPAIPSEN